VKPFLSDHRVENLKLQVYQRGCVIGIVITALAFILSGRDPIPYPLETAMTVVTGLFCLASLVFFRLRGLRYLAFFEWFAILTISIFFTLEFYRATLLATEQFNLRSSVFIWMPLVYIFTFLVLPNKPAFWVSLSFLGGLVVIGIISAFAKHVSWTDASHNLLLVQIYGSNLIYITLLHSIALLRDRYGEVERHSAQMTTLAMVDDLSGLANRRKLDQLLGMFVEQAHVRGRPFSIVMLDIDNFKQINDQFGHDRGDLVLKRVAEILMSNVREADQLGRWGGDEFLVCSPDTNEKQVQMLCRRLSEAVARSRFQSIARVTISFGAATLMPQESHSDLWKRADVSLLNSKREKTQSVSERGL
jgi:diguanylate cyclase (GGDEF)-like protein